MKHPPWQAGAALALVAAAVLAACGGGGTGPSAEFSSGSSGSSSSGSTGSTGSTSTPSSATSSGTITAFGSVFVNGHEFSTNAVRVIDDDSGTASSDTSGLEVGQVVDVVPAAGSTTAAPVASEIHVHPLARGYVDAIDAGASTLSVMGQTVQLDAATVFADHRACLSAASSPCAAVAGLSGLVATAGSGSSAVAGNYVSVDGFLYAGGSSGAQIVATLVSVRDMPAGAATAFKVEGSVVATAASSVTIGGLAVDLSAARCIASGAVVPCATAFSAGQVVSAFAAAAPGLPATSFTAADALLRPRMVVQTAGAAVELEGAVSSVSTAAPASLVVRGVGIDASALPTGSSLPAVGDRVLVTGTVAAGGNAITASAIKVLRAARAATYGFEGDVSGVTAGSGTGSYVVTLLGQSVAVDVRTQLLDLSAGRRGAVSSNPFNITTFQSYLAASASQHLVVQTLADASGALSAMTLVIVPASTVAAVEGTVDTTPAPVDSTTTGTPTQFAVHGLAVAADPAATVSGAGWWGRTPAATISAGDLVLVVGSYAGGTLAVSAPASGKRPSATDFVLDFGPPRTNDHGAF